MRKMLCGLLGAAAMAGAGAQQPEDWDTGVLTHRVDGCTRDGTRATLVFRFDMGIDFLVAIGTRGYDTRVGDIRKNVTGTLSADWRRIIARHTADDMRSGTARPERDMIEKLNTYTRSFGTDARGQQNVWYILVNAGLQPGGTYCR